MKNAMMAISEMEMGVIRTVEFNPTFYVPSQYQVNAVYN